MDQFIQYLYEYEHGERVRNLGFMKVENKMDKIEIQIYAKQLDEISGIYFKRQDGRPYIATWEAPELCQELQMTVESDVCLEEEVEEEVQPEPRTLPACTCEKIQRQDLSRLPRKEWKLANNNFLLHGYYNYHHLLYIEENDKVWIGVPGVFHPKEKMAAESFGFSDFRRDLTEKEENTEEDFGYWCRQVEHF